MVSTEQYEQMKAATVAEVALSYPQAITIFNKYNLDYCCHGSINFTKACRQSALDPELVWEEIQQAPATQKSSNQLNFRKWTSTMLIDFIVQHHHEYIRDSIPKIRELLDKITSVHGDTNPELLGVQSDFEELAEELLNHLPKEEEILFPAIKRIEGTESAVTDNVIMPSSLRVPMRIMEDEHERAGELIMSIRKKTDNYTVPSYGCPTYQLAYIMLQEFDNDLIQHIHIENNILFPRIKNESEN
ncbi:MAG: iron-sulfur cluster repair di-iron protein [Cyclobacteriaceae bacterium]|jgi:regulator of cell morphogenesis and NO signaling|nr:iron-sulfur cluster repair di-iron protein [Cyclobacteriaceae bacterium]